MAEKDYSGAEGVEKIQELIKDARIGMLTTVGAAGKLHARPMAIPKAPFDGTALWFITRSDSGKTDEIQRDSQVLVSFAEPKDGKYLSISGRASLVDDKSLLHEHWSDMAKAWFPQGEDDPAAALLRVDVEDAEYWASSSSSLVRFTKLAIASVTGADKTDVGDTGHITV